MSAATATALTALAGGAYADCDDISPGRGDTITCDANGVETRKIKDGSKEVTVNVLAGAEINVTDGDAIKLKDDDTVINNDGRIYGSDEAIVAGDRLIVNNRGQIEAADKGIAAENEDGDKASNVTVNNFAGATIISQGNEAVEAGDTARVLNEGTIKGFDDAIQVGLNAVIVNRGLIENTQTQDDLNADPSLEAQDAIDIDSGIIRNEATGTIKSTVNAAIDFDPSNDASTIDNEGVIVGTIAINTDKDDTGAQTVNQMAGTLEGTDGTALVLGKGDDTLNWTGGAIIGGADFGAGADMAVFDGALLSGPASVFSGTGLFDGGLDFDVVDLSTVSFADTKVTRAGSLLSLVLPGAISFDFINWEAFDFAEGRYAYAEVAAVAPVPLPAGGVLFGSALLGAGALTRRRKGRA